MKQYSEAQCNYIRTMGEFILKSSTERYGLMEGANAVAPEKLLDFSDEVVSIGVELISCAVCNVLANVVDRGVMREKMFKEIFGAIHKKVMKVDIEAKLQELSENETRNSGLNQH